MSTLTSPLYIMSLLTSSRFQYSAVPVLTKTMMISVMSILLLLPIFLFLLFNRKITKSLPLPPGPYQWPVVGNAVLIGNKPHITLAQLAHRHGPLISLRLGSQLVVVASSPDSAAQVLKAHDRALSGRHVPHVSYAKNPKRNHCSVGWTFECDEQWKFLRTLLRSEIFSPKVIESQGKLREHKVVEMVEYLRSKEGAMVKIGEVVFVSIFNFLGNVFFSKDFMDFNEGEKGEVYGIIRKLMETWAAPNVSDLYPILGRFDLQGLGKMAEEVFHQICNVWRSIIKERREKEVKGDESNPGTDFLDVLLHNDFSDDQINCLFLELFAAGTDTSASTIEWTLAELMRDQSAMNKVKEELEREIKGSDYVTELQLSSLTYLQACVKETLRLHPPAPLLLPRRATQDCEVMNYNIPKDTQVLVNVWAIGRDGNSWEEPLRFMPERFIKNPQLDFKGNDFEYLPFGGGRRICPGLPMGIRQVHLALASLIYHFDWTLPHAMHPHHIDVNEKFGVTLQKEEPLILIPLRNKFRS